MTARAIVRPPGANFADGLTTASLGAPDYALACRQHAAYCAALETAGVAVTVLPADPAHPDAHFVEDAAVIVGSRAVLTRPGAAERRDEPMAMREPLSRWFPDIGEIVAPGTLDGGDVCDAGERLYVGLSQRTNRDGADQLARIAKREGRVPVIVDVRALPGVLHLKSAMAYLGDARYVSTDALLPLLPVARDRIVWVTAREEYAANCVRVKEVVFVASGHPRLQADLGRAGYTTVALDVSEFRKMDGGLSCLSIRF